MNIPSWEELEPIILHCYSKNRYNLTKNIISFEDVKQECYFDYVEVIRRWKIGKVKNFNNYFMTCCAWKICKLLKLDAYTKNGEMVYPVIIGGLNDYVDMETTEDTYEDLYTIDELKSWVKFNNIKLTDFEIKILELKYEFQLPLLDISNYLDMHPSKMRGRINYIIAKLRKPLTK